MNLRSLKNPFELNDLFNQEDGLIPVDQVIAKNKSIVSECAALSLDVYRDAGRPPLPHGWTLFKYKEYSTGYAGACYVKNHPHPTHIVIAHRGTVPTSLPDLLDDYVLAINAIPLLHYKSMSDFFSLVSKKLYEVTYSREILKNTVFVVTGHSLGAVLADLTGTLANFYPTITFENPGTKKMIKQGYKNMGATDKEIAVVLSVLNQTCRTYQAGVNLINTCNEQLGRTFRIQDVIYKWPNILEFPMSSSFALNKFYMTHYSLDQHSIDKIADQLKSNYQAIEISNPIGFKAGYIEYLDKSHKDYWKKYFDIMWDNNPGKTPEFYDNFIKYCFNELEKIQKEAMGINLMIENLPSLNNSSTLFGKRDKQVDDIINEFVIIERPDISNESASRCTIL